VKLFLINNNIFDKIKIFLLSCGFFFWDFRILKFDPRLLIILLLIFTLSKYKIILSNNYKKLFIYGSSIFVFIAVHFYINLLIDKKNIIVFPKDIFFLYIIFIAVILNLDLIRKNLRSIIFFFVFFFVISTTLYFIINGYKHPFLMSCSYHGGWHAYTRFFFSENSHLAIMSVPIIIFYLIGNNFINLSKIEKFFLIIFFLVAIINYTATFLVGLVLSLIAIYISNYKNFKKENIIFAILLFLLSCFFIFTDKECSEKIFKTKASVFGTEKNLSLSGAVFVNSLNIAMTTIKDRPLGWGFNRYEFAYKKYVISETEKFKLSSYHHKQFEWNLNSKDGSNNLAKLLTEFGIFSFIIFIFFTYFLFSKKSTFQEKSFLIPLVLTQLLLRGAGYFNGGFMLCVLIMLSITLSKKNT
jgi:hypothetical protein